jgi:predicted nuclease of restriction endonuclease-like RecB superfamily
MKFRGLLHRAERVGKTLVLRLDGPLSLFRHTQRYGLQLALFLPTVLALERFELTAVITWGKERKPASFSLSQADGLQSQRRERGLWESEEEKQLRRQWKKLDTPWKLERSSRIVDLDGRDLLVPDYVLRHPDGRKALVDLVWSWRRATFERRLALLREAAPPNLIIAVALRRHVGEEDSPELPDGAVVPFKGVIQAKRLIEAAERVAC